MSVKREYLLQGQTNAWLLSTPTASPGTFFGVKSSTWTLIFNWIYNFAGGIWLFCVCSNSSAVSCRVSFLVWCPWFAGLPKVRGWARFPSGASSHVNYSVVTQASKPAGGDLLYWISSWAGRGWYNTEQLSLEWGRCEQVREVCCVLVKIRR